MPSPLPPHRPNRRRAMPFRFLVVGRYRSSSRQRLRSNIPPRSKTEGWRLRCCPLSSRPGTLMPGSLQQYEVPRSIPSARTFGIAFSNSASTKSFEAGAHPAGSILAPSACSTRCTTAASGGRSTASPRSPGGCLQGYYPEQSTALWL